MTKHRKHASETDTNRSFMVCLSLKTVLVLNIKRASAERVFKRSSARARKGSRLTPSGVGRDDRRGVESLSNFSPRRSEERRVGKECRSRWSPDHEKKKKRQI